MRTGKNNPYKVGDKFVVLDNQNGQGRCAVGSVLIVHDVPNDTTVYDTQYEYWWKLYQIEPATFEAKWRNR